MADEEFWDSTPAQIDARARRYQEETDHADFRSDYAVARIMAALTGNAPLDFLPDRWTEKVVTVWPPKS